MIKIEEHVICDLCNTEIVSKDKYRELNPGGDKGAVHIHESHFVDPPTESINNWCISLTGDSGKTLTMK